MRMLKNVRRACAGLGLDWLERMLCAAPPANDVELPRTPDTEREVAA